MPRFKLFLFYTAMAWASMVNPAEGGLMVSDAEDGAAMRQRRRGRAVVPRWQRADMSSGMVLTLILIITGLWALVLVRFFMWWLA